MKRVRAWIEWTSEEEGGRASPPTGPTYAANARVEGVPNLLSVHLGTRRPLFAGIEYADLRFMAPGIVDKLEPGRKISITEGPQRVVATATIVSSALEEGQQEPADLESAREQLLAQACAASSEEFFKVARQVARQFNLMADQLVTVVTTHGTGGSDAVDLRGP